MLQAGKILLREGEKHNMAKNERMAVSEEYISYEKYLWLLMDEAHHHKLPIEVIGYETSKRSRIQYPIYRLIIHPNLKETVCIVAGLHGNEIAGPLSIPHMITNILHELPEHYRYVIYPMINPSGFDLRQRFDADNRDLNAIYSTTLKSGNYHEVQEFYQDALKFAPFEAVITLHEDSERDQFYMYGLGKENLPYYHAICGFARIWIEPWSNAEIEGCCTDEHGFILSNARDHAFDGALYKQGLTKLAFTYETPGRLDLNFRVNMMVQLVLLGVHMLNARRWMTSPFVVAKHTVS